VLPGLVKLGLRGVEVAPTRIAPWGELSPSRLAAYGTMLNAMGLSVAALQSILFNVPDISLLGDKASFDRLLDHLRRVAGVATVLGAQVAVFGSPRQRARGEMSAETAFLLGTERLHACAQVYMSEAGGTIGLEPVPAHYGGDFLCTAQEVTAMVHVVDHPGLRLHLDTGCVMLGSGCIASAITEGRDILAHFHIAEPDLGEFGAPLVDHAAASQALLAANYAGWRSIEMREVPDWQTACETAVRFALSTYESIP